MYCQDLAKHSLLDIECGILAGYFKGGRHVC